MSVSLGNQVAVAQEHSDIIVLDGPSESPQAQYVQALLEKAYAKLGYTVQYQKMPVGRSFIEANTGRIDGLRARVDSVADTYENLIKVPYRILDFRVLLIGNSELCGTCDFDSIRNLVIPRGYLVFTDHLDTSALPSEVIRVVKDMDALELLEAKKVDAALVSDVNLSQGVLEQNPQWQIRTVIELPDYHYLHKQHAGLVDSLNNTLLEFEKQGLTTQLQRQYGVNAPAIN